MANEEAGAVLWDTTGKGPVCFRPPAHSWIPRPHLPGNYTEDQDEHQQRADEDLKNRVGDHGKGLAEEVWAEESQGRSSQYRDRLEPGTGVLVLRNWGLVNEAGR